MSIPAKEECYSCESTCRNTHVNPCDDCDVRKQTRAEQIRAMTDEELAQFLEKLYEDFQTGACPDCGWLEWLRQKADDDR